MTCNRPSFIGPRRIDEDDVKNNEPVRSRSDAPSMGRLLESRLSRRSTLRGGLGLAAMTIFAGAGLAGCSDDHDIDDALNNADSGEPSNASPLMFDSVARSTADQVVVPDGYSVDTLLAWGTPIVMGVADFDPASNTPQDQAGQTGAHHDGMFLFADESDPNTGVLVINHENISREYMFPDGRSEEPSATLSDDEGNPVMVPTVPDEVRREMAAHGISVVRIRRDPATGRWAHEMDQGINRRITAMTEIRMSGPAAGNPLLVTPYSPQGDRTRGTLNNCGRGHTPWGTYLSCEENIQGYFVNGSGEPTKLEQRYGITQTGFGFFWNEVSDNADDEVDGEFARFNVAADSDWRNEVNNFGWVVEVDPLDPNAAPVKRTAMGRFRHEGAEPSPAVDGQRIAFYMGDDARGEYCYKFVTADAYSETNPLPDMLDRGTLYVARFNDDSSGNWLALDMNANEELAARFADQAELLINTRIAADILGATPMDRPEWSAVDPNNGDVYYTLTNNTDRGGDDEEPVNAANPRADNVYGHIIRQTETDGDPAATTFSWDIFVFGAPSIDDADLNRSGLTADNEFGGPDGLWFDRRGVLWIQTDNGGNAVAEATNDQMLAVVPSSLAGDRTITPETQASLKRFLVGPTGCEMTGSELSADATTLFANIQHPSGGFPDYTDGIPPRSATVAVTRDDGGTVAL